MWNFLEHIENKIQVWSKSVIYLQWVETLLTQIFKQLFSCSRIGRIKVSEMHIEWMNKSFIHLENVGKTFKEQDPSFQLL